MVVTNKDKMDGFNKTHQNSTQCQLRAQQIPNEAELSSVRILIALALVLMKNKIAFFFFSVHKNTNCFDAEEQNLCQGKLTKKECLGALKSMDSYKSPWYGRPSSGILQSLLEQHFRSTPGSFRLRLSKWGGVMRLIPKNDAKTPT